VINVLFVAGLAALLSGVLAWGIKTLPAERWQMIASIPRTKSADGAWSGLNLTFYGFFSATATTFGIAIAIILMETVGTPMIVAALLITAIVALCVPASRIVAAVVEGKRDTFTIAGAAFVAALVLPPAVVGAQQVLASQFHITIHVLPLLAAAGIAYSLSESIGRLACLSFGCCYGSPVRNASPRVARLFQHHHLVFHGSTKKAAYASGLAEEPLIPVQPITSILFAVAGIVGIALFLSGHWRTAAIVPAVATWGWRSMSEILRADYRGDRRISPYQVMSLMAMIYLVITLSLIPSEGPTPNLALGLAKATSTVVVVLLEACWVGLFLFYGRSRVTASTVSFHVVPERI
jgi:hypothetical protein